MKHIKDFMSKPREILKVFLYTILASLAVVYPEVAWTLFLAVLVTTVTSFTLVYFGYCVANNKWLTLKHFIEVLK